MSLRERLLGLERDGSRIGVGLVGAGQMGTALIAQISAIPGMEIAAVADLDVDRATEAVRAAVLAIDGTRAGRDPVITADALEVAAHPDVDVVVEATGSPETGARIAYETIARNRHVVMLNFEADVTVGALLRRMSDSAGVVYTGSAGDEPGALMELLDFAGALGFQIVAAGKGKNNPLDPAATPESVADQAAARGMSARMLASFVDGTKTMVEMAAVANATGLVPDVPGMHGPAEDEPRRLAQLFSLNDQGGILGQEGVVDYVRGVAPGVFVVVRAPSEPVRRTMAYVEMGEGPNHVLYRPYHLTSLETPVSIARAALLSEATIAPGPRPSAEVVAIAKRDLAAGERLAGIGSPQVFGRVYRVHEARDLLPIGLAAGARVTDDVPRGQPIPRAAVQLADDSFIVHLRALQDALLGSNATAPAGREMIGIGARR